MSTPWPANTSQTARLINHAPSFAVGWQEPLYLPAPAAGQEWSHVVDGRFYERLVSAQWTLTTDLVVGTRFPVLALYDSNNRQIISVPSSGGIAASTAVTVNLMTGLSVLSGGTIGNTWGTLPDFLIPPGWYWKSVTAALDAGDQESGITLLVQRFPNDAAMITAGD